MTSIWPETPRAKSFRLRLPEWRAHLPGQYYTIRLTAPDGYQAIRSYSIASSPLDEGVIELTVDCLMDGEVSPFLHDVVEVGDELEVRGPLTEYFTWQGSSPLLLIGGGSGVVPLMCMLRHQRRAFPEVPVRLLYSVRSPDDVFYRSELGEETTLDLHPKDVGGLDGGDRAHHRRARRVAGLARRPRLRLRTERIRRDRHRSVDGVRL